MKKKLLILVGASASGKDTILKMLKQHGMNGVITYTTRPPRHYEENHVDYHFVTKTEFENKNMIERVEYRDWLYGTCEEDIIDNSVIIVEPHGLKQIKSKEKELDLDILTVFVKTSRANRLQRLLRRGDDYREIVRRLSTDEELFANIEDVVDYILINDYEVMDELRKDVTLFYNNFFKE